MAQVVTRKILKLLKNYFQKKKKKKKGSIRIRTRTRFFIYLNRFLIRFCNRYVKVI